MKEKVIIQTVRHTTGRVLIIGDIHGCLAELQALLTKLHYHDKGDKGIGQHGGGHDDVVIHVGDLVNKGPDSYGVVRHLQKIGAYGVLGNHDIKLINLADKLRSGASLSKKEQESSLLELARHVPEDVYAYLRTIPHVLRVPQHNVIVVHAGLDPSLRLEDQDVEALTRMRNLIKRKKFDKKAKKDPEHVAGAALSLSAAFAAVERNGLGKPWAKVWSRLTSTTTTTSSSGAPISCSDHDDDEDGDDEDDNDARCLPEYKNTTVVFGHDAKRRLQEHKGAMGLDSGCCYGGQLTAWVLPDRALVSVPGYQNGSKV